MKLSNTQQSTKNYGRLTIKKDDNSYLVQTVSIDSLYEKVSELALELDRIEDETPRSHRRILNNPNSKVLKIIKFQIKSLLESIRSWDELGLKYFFEFVNEGEDEVKKYEFTFERKPKLTIKVVRSILTNGEISNSLMMVIRL